MPSQPRLLQFFGIATRAHDLFEICEAQAFALVAFRTVLTLAVVALHRSSNFCEFGALLRVLWGRKRQSEFQQFQFPFGRRREVRVFKSTRLLGEFGGCGNESFISIGRKRFSIVGDESALYPFGAAGFDVQVQQPFLGIGKKFFRLAG